MTSLERELSRIETQLHESRDETRERSRERWLHAAPNSGLTWGRDLTGDAFVEKARSYGAYGRNKEIIEIGPGYGRLLSSCLERGLEFDSYVGVDISTANLRGLEHRFSGKGRIRFMQGDVETARIPEPADTVLSSLTFKHLYPSFERALKNLAGQMKQGAVAIFDLIEGERRYFEPDGKTYIRWYTRPEIQEIASRAGFEVEAFDEVRHSPDFARLLVIIRKQP